MAGGVFGVSRGIWSDPDFAPEPFTEREAFIWLVGAAAWKDGRTRGAHGPIALKRGEFCYSVRFLATAWKWSKSSVARFLDALTARDTVRDTSRQAERVYFIKNYNRFQKVGTPTAEPKDAKPGTNMGQRWDSDRDTTRDTARDTENVDKGQAPRALDETPSADLGQQTGQQTGHRPTRKRDKEESLKHRNIEKKEDSPPPPRLRRRGVVDLPNGEDLALAQSSYNLTAAGVGWPPCQHLTPKRVAALRARLVEVGGVVGWAAAMERAASSDFLTGRIPRGEGHENWSPDIDFFLQQKSFTKLMEGKYDNRRNGRHRNGASSYADAGNEWLSSASVLNRDGTPTDQLPGTPPDAGRMERVARTSVDFPRKAFNR